MQKSVQVYTYETDDEAGEVRIFLDIGKRTAKWYAANWAKDKSKFFAAYVPSFRAAMTWLDEHPVSAR